MNMDEVDVERFRFLQGSFRNAMKMVFMASVVDVRVTRG